MKWVLGPAALLLSATVGAQGVGLFIQTSAREAIKRSPKPPVSGNPLNPAGFPNPPQRSGAIPTPEPGAEDDRFLQILKGLVGGGRNEIYTFRGGVELRYRGLDLFANSAVADLRNEEVSLIGSVRVIGVDQVVTGARVDLNFRDRTYRAFETSAELRPSFLEGRTLGDVYVDGLRSYGSRIHLYVDDAHVTTCPLDHPHYEFVSRQAEVRVGRRIILRDTKVRLFDRTLANIPYLSFPLDRYSNRYFPEFGYSNEEGYFVKFTFIAPVGQYNEIETRLDYYTKLGLGLGNTYRYEDPSMIGFAQYYFITGQRSLQGSSSHRQRIGQMTFQLDNTYQRFDALNAPQNTIFQTRSSLTIPNSNGTTRLGLIRNSNEGDNFQSVQQTVSLNHQQRLSDRTNTSLDVAYATSNTSFSGGGVERKQLDVRLRAQHELDVATAEFEYQRAIPVGQIDNFFSGTDRTPMLTLRSDSRRIFGESVGKNLPLTFESSFGELVDTSRRRRILRTYFDVAYQRPSSMQQRHSFGFNGRLRQGIYSDDTAQVTLDYAANYRYSLGRDTAFNVRYSFLRGYGFSPLAIDHYGMTNLFTADLSVRPIPSLLFAAQTGYDFLETDFRSTNWQNISLRSEWRPSTTFLLRSLSSYDTRLQNWSNFRFDLGARMGQTTLSVGSRYDVQRHTWGNINVYLDSLQIGRLKVSTVLNYNGFIDKFEARHFQFTLDMHCAEAILTIIDNQVGFRSGTQIGLFLRLKALPFDTGFGVGSRGQAIGTGTGIGG
ncbi:MAG: hypothetical protein ACK4XJ_03155 [Fimbriimonadaceae bacterium]